MNDFSATLRFLSVFLMVAFASNVALIVYALSKTRRRLNLNAALSCLLAFAAFHLILFFVVTRMIGVIEGFLMTSERVRQVGLYDAMFDYIKVQGIECRMRFLCEVSKRIVAGEDVVSSLLKLVSAFGGTEANYVSGVLVGLGDADCSAVYAQCGHSPLLKAFPFLQADSESP